MSKIINMHKFLMLVSTLLFSSQLLAGPTEDVSTVLDKFHKAAATADYDGYFSFFTDDAFFLGTDASERWSVPEFKVYAKPSFDAGRGWTYVKLERNVMLSADGKLAWFDEILGNKKLGRCRGTGVLRLTDRGWKVAHYSLTLLIPNDIADDVGKMTMEIDAKQ